MGYKINKPLSKTAIEAQVAPKPKAKEDKKGSKKD